MLSTAERAYVETRARELMGTSNRQARALGLASPFAWDDERRFGIRAELDAFFFHKYGISRDDAAYILDTFPIVKRRDEERHGSYVTKDAILAVYDELARCRAEGRAYVSPLDPPPGQPR